jgi:hypothetical protein
MRSLRSRPSPSRASHRSQPRKAVGLGVCRVAQRAQTTPVSQPQRYSVARTAAQPDHAQQLAAMCSSQGPPSPTGESDMI